MENIEDILLGKQRIDMDLLASSVVLSTAYRPSFGRKKNLAEHTDMLYEEFSGGSSIKFLHAALIMALRRKINVEVNFHRFMRLWKDYMDVLLETLDSRWLVSASDTLADFSPNSNVSRLAASASLFVNTIKLYETERFFSAASDFPDFRNNGRTPLYDGMTAFMATNGDMLSNLLQRIDHVFGVDDVVSMILRELVQRAHQHGTVFSRIAGVNVNRVGLDALLATNNQAKRSFSLKNATRSAPPMNEISGVRGYVLLNDTGRLSRGFHCGTTFACSALRQGLMRRGVPEIAWANDEKSFTDIMATKGRDVSLVVLNGEGTLHHGAPRARELLNCCFKAKSLGVRVALVNTVWEANPQDFYDVLSAFDTIHVRERRSLAALNGAGAAKITPDMSMVAFDAFYGGGRFDPPMYELAVMDSVNVDNAHRLQDLASSKRVPFYAMPYQALLNLRQRALEEGLVLQSYPSLLQAFHVRAAQHWVTGRFHGMLAALCAGRPVAVVGSNTHKIEGSLEDAGLLEHALLPKDWHVRDAKQQAEMLDRHFSCWDKECVEKTHHYINDATHRIEGMFDELAALAGQ